MCINSVKETCFSQKYQKWICLILELNSSIIMLLQYIYIYFFFWGGGDNDIISSSNVLLMCQQMNMNKIKKTGKCCFFRYSNKT